MSVDLSILEKHGVSVDRLKTIFTATKGKDKDIADARRKVIRDRISNGITFNIKNFRHWYACDIAWDVPFRQTTYSLVRGMLDRKLLPSEIMSTLEGADLTEMLTVYDKSGKMLTGRFNQSDVGEIKVNGPTFFNIFLPLAKSITTIRAAAIINSYRQVPLFEYEAIKSTPNNRMKSEILTDRIELMSSQYGYFDVVKQAVMNTLHYGKAILFPVESWHTQRQIQMVDGKEKEVVVKEGVRFHIPHPSRIYHDESYRPSTLNSDTGTRFGGYWSIERAECVINNKNYWNKDNVSTGAVDWIAKSPAFFNTVYSSCALKFPTQTDRDVGDRETRSAFYTANDYDRALTIINHFELLNPKTEGIGDYDYDVWFRYLIAGDDTVIYAEPLPYCPMPYFGYDALETRAQNASLTLEVLPFQDHISNLFSQYLLTIKNNLTNLTFFDTNQVDKDIVDSIRNLGQKSFTDRNFFPMDMRTNRIGGQNNVAEAFQTFNFPRQPTDELITGVQEILKVLERLLVLSPQEMAQTATHELTAEEVRNMNDAKSTRYEFTASAIDRGIYAVKNLLYQGLMNYGEEDVWARLSTPVDAKQLESLGFTFDGDPDEHSVLVTGKKSALALESFVSTRDGDLRVSSPQMAQSMTQLLQVMMNPAILQEVGPKQIVDLVNEICQMSGLPRDFRLSATGGAAQNQVAEMQQQLQQLAAKIEQSAVADVANNLKPVFQQQAQKFDEIHAELEKLASLVQQPQPPPPNAIPSPLPQSSPPFPGPAIQPPPMAEPPGGPPVSPGPPVPVAF